MTNEEKSNYLELVSLRHHINYDNSNVKSRIIYYKPILIETMSDNTDDYKKAIKASILLNKDTSTYYVHSNNGKQFSKARKCSFNIWMDNNKSDKELVFKYFPEELL